MRKGILLLFIVPALTALLSAEPRSAERHLTFHVLHYSFNLTVHDSTGSIEGTAALRVVPLDTLSSLELDAADMVVRSVTLVDSAGKEASAGFLWSGEKLILKSLHTLAPGDTLTASISYSATPRTGLFFIRPDSANPRLPRVVWSQGEEEENHHWIPCYDYPNDKATCEMRVTVHERYVAISNGALLNVTHDPAQRTKTFFWYSAKPFSSYLISLIVGEYEKIDSRYKAIPVQYYVYPGRGEDAVRAFSHTPSMMEFFSEKLGYDYPWPKYAQTVVPLFTYGGMENVSATTLTDRALRDARAQLDGSADGLVAHELAHQWFGDLLTCRSWAHAWLNEGFATYFQSLYDEQSMGKDQLQQEMIGRRASTLAADTGLDRRPTVTDRFYEPEDVFDGQIYARGACILHMLRFLLGDEVFWAGIRHYVDIHQYGLVTTDDFRRAMEESSGSDLRWFFDEWVYHAGYPRYSISAHYDSLQAVVRLRVRQDQQVDSLTPLFRMPVDVEIATRSGSIVHRVLLAAEREQEISLPSPEPPLNILFDKGGWLLARVEFDKPVADWLFQLGHGDIAAREEALARLAPSIDLREVQQAVGRVMTEHPFYGVRRTAARILGRANDPDVLHLLAPAFRDPDARVRASATASLGRFKTLDALVALGTFLKSDSSYAVQAAALRALMSIDTAHALTYYEKGMAMDSFNDSIRAVAIQCLGATRTGEAKRRILDLTAAGHSEEVRLAAITALVADWPHDDDVFGRLVTLTNDGSHRVRRRAVEKLGSLARPEARPLLTRIAEHEANSLLRRDAHRSLVQIERAGRTISSPFH